MNNKQNNALTYIGHFYGATGRIDDRFSKPIEVQWRGEILIEGQMRDDALFEVLRMPRVAILGGQPEEQPGRDLIGLLSLWGPVEVIQIVNSNDRNERSYIEILLNLHYRDLALETPQRPRRETIIARLYWTGGTNNGVNYTMHDAYFIAQRRDTEGRKEYVSALEIDQFPDQGGIDFKPEGSALESFFNPNLNRCKKPQKNCAGKKHPPEAWQLPLKFINLSGEPNDMVSAECNKQLNAVCEIWHKKAALEVVWPRKDPGSPDHLLQPKDIIEGLDQHKNDFKHFTTPDIDFTEKLLDVTSQLKPELETKLFPFTDDFDFQFINVYIVKTLFVEDLDIGSTREAITYEPGLSTAYCILALDEMPKKKHLLAHEICHVLGLGHPGSNDVHHKFHGELKTIAQWNASEVEAFINTEANMEVLKNQADVNPILSPPPNTPKPGTPGTEQAEYCFNWDDPV